MPSPINLSCYFRPLGLNALAFSMLCMAIIATASNPATASDHSPSDPAATTQPATTKPGRPQSAPDKSITMDQFLNRLMVAESGGNDKARNPLSTATGPFQFIESTFLSVMRRHFPKRVESLSDVQILALRTNRHVARDAAKAYTRDNATHLAAAGHKPTFPHLRLAFLLGAGGASRVLNAKPQTSLTTLLAANVMRANPWMNRHTASSLIARAARDISLTPDTTAGAKPRIDPKTGKLIYPRQRHPRIRVRCNLALPSCKRWLSLKRKALARSKSRRRTQSAAQQKR